MRPLSLKANLIFFCCIAFFVWYRPISISGAYEVIGVGMTERQVIRIMGMPPGEYYSSRECHPFSMQSRGEKLSAPKKPMDEPTTELIWYFDECGIEVYLEDGRVVRKWQHDTIGPDSHRTLSHKIARSFWWILR